MELFDILDENGEKTGKTKERNRVHQDGDWHGSVHIWIIENGKVLLQKRSAEKESFPLCIDAACSGHIDAGEKPVTAASRELFEEMGIQNTEFDFQFLFTQKICVNLNRFVSNEINYVYLFKKAVSHGEIKFQKEEIDSVIWEDIEVLKEHLANKDQHYCLMSEEFEKVLSYIV